MEPFLVCSTTVHKGPKEPTSVPAEPLTRRVSLFVYLELPGFHAFLSPFYNWAPWLHCQGWKDGPRQGLSPGVICIFCRDEFTNEGLERRLVSWFRTLQQMFSSDQKPQLQQSAEMAVEEVEGITEAEGLVTARALNVQAVLRSPPCPYWSFPVSYQKSFLIAGIS